MEGMGNVGELRKVFCMTNQCINPNKIFIDIFYPDAKMGYLSIWIIYNAYSITISSGAQAFPLSISSCCEFPIAFSYS